MKTVDCLQYLTVKDFGGNLEVLYMKYNPTVRYPPFVVVNVFLYICLTN